MQLWVNPIYKYDVCYYLHLRYAFVTQHNLHIKSRVLLHLEILAIAYLAELVTWRCVVTQKYEVTSN